MLVHIVADYGPNDLAFAEVAQRIKLHLPDAELVLTPVSPFDTIAAGFCIAQLGLNPAPPGTLIYHNIAPREDDDSARSGNAGERLAFARLPTGVRVVGVSAGHTFSFVRDRAEELRWASVEAEGSQFRSRDLFPQAAAAIVLGKPEALDKAINLKDIPDIPAGRVAYIDGYGNLKTTLRRSDVAAKDGARVKVRIGDVEREAIISDGTFSVAPGELSLAPGSSGWPDGKGEKIRWLELFLRSGNACEHCGHPEPGSPVAIA